MIKGVRVCTVSLVDLIKKEDDKYISVSAFIKLVSNHTKDSDDLVIEYLGKFCLSDHHDNISVYTKKSGNWYSSEYYITYLISKRDEIDNFRFHTMSELEKSDKFPTSYFLKDDIFNASFIKSLNLNPDSYKKPFIDVEVIDNPIDRDLDQNDQNYISALKYVNDLGKGIGSGKPLKLALEYLVKNISFSEVELYLYDAGKEKYFLVSHTDSLNYTTSIELLEGIYHTLDGSQRGINFSDTALKPFKYFYFEFSDLPDLSSIYPDTIGQKGLNQRENQLPDPNPKPLNGTNPITNLGENQRLLITYAFFSAEDMTCLIIDENPAYIKSNANYLRHHRMICKAIDAGALVLNDADEIPAKQVKTWLANHNFIYKGFNDNLSNDRDKMGIAAVGHVIKTYDQLVEELATANNRIKKLEQVKTEANAPKQQEKELDVDEEPNLKDSAYFLIAVLKDLLLDIEITGYYFQSDKDKGKKEPTQTVLAQHIEGMGIKDLKTRNINGLFAKANAMLSDAKKS